MNRITRALALTTAALVLGLSGPALAQNAPLYRNSAGQIVAAQGVCYVLADNTCASPPAGNAASPIVTSPGTATSTVTNSTVSVANTFQSALAASTTRKGCTILNKAAVADLLVYIGAPGSASAAKAVPLKPNQPLYCTGPSGIVISDQISVTSSVAGAGSEYVVISQ